MCFREFCGDVDPLDRYDPLGWYRSIIRRGLKGRWFSAPGKVESSGDMLALILRGTLPEGEKVLG